MDETSVYSKNQRNKKIETNVNIVRYGGAGQLIQFKTLIVKDQVFTNVNPSMPITQLKTRQHNTLTKGAFLRSKQCIICVGRKGNKYHNVLNSHHKEVQTISNSRSSWQYPPVLNVKHFETTWAALFSI